MFLENNVVLSRQRARIVTCLRSHSGMPWFQCISSSESVFVNNRRVSKINDVLVGPGVTSNPRTFGRSFDVSQTSVTSRFLRIRVNGSVTPLMQGREAKDLCDSVGSTILKNIPTSSSGDRFVVQDRVFFSLCFG